MHRAPDLTIPNRAPRHPLPNLWQDMVHLHRTLMQNRRWQPHGQIVTTRVSVRVSQEGMERELPMESNFAQLLRLTMEIVNLIGMAKLRVAQSLAAGGVAGGDVDEIKKSRVVGNVKVGKNAIIHARQQAAMAAGQKAANYVAGITGHCAKSSLNHGMLCNIDNAVRHCGGLSLCEWKIPDDAGFLNKSKCGNTAYRNQADNKMPCLIQYVMYKAWKDGDSVEQVSNTLAALGYDNEPYTTYAPQPQEMKCVKPETPTAECANAVCTGKYAPFDNCCKCTPVAPGREVSSSYPAMCGEISSTSVATNFPEVGPLDVSAYPLSPIYGAVRQSLLDDNLAISRFGQLNRLSAAKYQDLMKDSSAALGSINPSGGPAYTFPPTPVPATAAPTGTTVPA